MTGPAGGIEKLEVPDGAPREIPRTKDETRCYLPESRTIKVDRRSDPRSFPALLPEQRRGRVRRLTQVVREQQSDPRPRR